MKASQKSWASSRLSSAGAKFFESLGSPKFISAPMVDQSSLSWRLMVKQNGADLAFTQMHHARNFVIDKNYRTACIDWNDYSNIKSDKGKEERDRKLDRSNLIVQLAGDDPDTLIKAARYVEKDVSAVDLNLGCPQKIAKRGNYGAYLLSDPKKVVKILETMVKELECPVTAKIRMLHERDFNPTVELCKELERVGVSMITVHGRTVESSKIYTGPANWEVIRRVKEAVGIPVVANGGISCRADALKCLEESGADAVMSSEALLENPKLFCEKGDYDFHHDFIRSQLQTVDEFLEILTSHVLPRPLNQVVRSHLFKMLYRFVDAPSNRDLRELLSEGNFEEMLSVVATLKTRLSATSFDMELSKQRGLINDTHWYFRHRDEKAKKRIYSTRRGSKIQIGRDGALGSSEPTSEVGLEDKLSALKKRLQEKRASVLNQT